MKFGNASKIKPKGADDLVLILCFLWLFPGYILLQLLVMLGYLPLVFGGLGGPMALAVAPLVIWRFTGGVLQRRVNLNIIDIIFVAYVLCLIVAAASAFANFDTRARAFEGLGVAGVFIITYLMFRIWSVDGKFSRRALLFSLLCISAAVIFSPEQGDEVDAIYEFAGQRAFRDYHAAGWMLLVCSILWAATEQRIVRRWVVLLGTLAVLTLNGARAENLMFVPAIMVMELLRSRSRPVAVFYSFFALGVLSLIWRDLILLTKNQRLVELLTNFDHDESVSQRSLANEHAIRVIEDNFWLGDYGNYPPGLYAHNALSAWVDLGLLGFVVFCVLLLSFLMLINNYNRGAPDRATLIAAIGVGVAALLLCATSKVYLYRLTPVAIGIVALAYQSVVLRRRLVWRGSSPHAPNMPVVSKR
jgi:hypothetical protein